MIKYSRIYLRRILKICWRNVALRYNDNMTNILLAVLKCSTSFLDVLVQLINVNGFPFLLISSLKLTATRQLQTSLQLIQRQRHILDLSLCPNCRPIAVTVKSLQKLDSQLKFDSKAVFRRIRFKNFPKNTNHLAIHLKPFIECQK